MFYNQIIRIKLLDISIHVHRTHKTKLYAAAMCRSNDVKNKTPMQLRKYKLQRGESDMVWYYIKLRI